MLLAPGRPRMLLNILQKQGQPLTKNYLTPNVNNVEGEKSQFRGLSTSIYHALEQGLL